ncbi:MAG: CBS and ACT domain-containing protein [Sporomusaceae bacterium]|nr:CBS and ACT domain-containing protein [Sporomusaceae bacterium]
MFVATRMTPNPVTITPSTPVTEANHLMHTNRFRRLPVVDNGKLIGIVTDRDLREVSPSPATALSIHELNYLLSKMQVKDVMKKNVVTITEEATIEEAALLMVSNRIGGLVVVDGAGSVTGVITETDIFKCFIEIMGLEKGKTRLTVDVADKVGRLHEITGIFAELSINISSLAIYPLSSGEYELVIRADVRETEQLVKRLEAAGCPVKHIAHIGNNGN